MKGSYYSLLEVSPSASEEVIRGAYRTLVKKYHPDVYIGDKTSAEQIMKDINEAYEVLSNPEKRQRYDEFLKNNSYIQENITQNSESKVAKTPIYKSTKGGCIFSLVKLSFNLAILGGCIFLGIHYTPKVTQLLGAYIQDFKISYNQQSIDSISIADELPGFTDKYYFDTEIPTLQDVTGIACTASFANDGALESYDYVPGRTCYQYDNVPVIEFQTIAMHWIKQGLRKQTFLPLTQQF